MSNVHKVIIWRDACFIDGNMTFISPHNVILAMPLLFTILDEILFFQRKSSIAYWLYFEIFYVDFVLHRRHMYLTI